MIKKAAGIAAILLAILAIGIGIAKADTVKVKEVKLDAHDLDAKQLKKVDKVYDLKAADVKLYVKDVKLSSDVKLASALKLKEKTESLAPLTKKSLKLHTRDAKFSKAASVKHEDASFKYDKASFKRDKKDSTKLYKTAMVKLGDDKGLLFLEA